MVAIKGSVEGYLAAPPDSIDAILLFGADAGQVAERARNLAKTIAGRTTPPGDVLRIEEADVDGDVDQLSVELRTIAMFGGRKVVRTTAGRRFNAAVFKDLLSSGRLEGFLIVEAGALKADDALRKLFEAAPAAAAIPCQGDEARDLDALVRSVLGAAGLTISPDAHRLLVSRLGADRSLSRAEIDKLALYAQGTARIEEADVEAIVGDAANLAIDRIVDAAARGDAARAAIECDRAVASGESPQYVLIATLRHLQRLHRVRFAIESGLSLDDAVKALRPPLFFRQRDAFLHQLERWPAARLTRALGRLVEAQSLTRSGGSFSALDETMIVQGALLDVARLAVVKR